MFVFTCPNGHTSHSASRAPTDPDCPTCGAPTIFTGEDGDTNEGIVVLVVSEGPERNLPPHACAPTCAHMQAYLSTFLRVNYSDIGVLSQ